MKSFFALLLTVVCIGCGYKSPSTAPAPQPGVTPAISQLAPDNTNAGSTAFVLTVNGSNFAGDAVVNFNGAPMTTTVVSGNQVTAAIPASSVATSGTVPVSVTNPGTAASGPYSGGTMSETSATVNFTIN